MTPDKTTHTRPKSLLCLMALTLTALSTAFLTNPAHSQTASLAQAGLRTAANQGQTQGQFNGVQSDAIGNLYLLLDQHDGVRLLKTDPTATNVIAEAHLGAAGDVGAAMALDPAGNVYITGSASSGTLVGTAGSAFSTPAGTATSFVAKFDAALNPLWLTFTGSDRMTAVALAANATGVYVTGSIFAATLPVTPSAILQTPSYGSRQNGFVTAFDPTGKTLLYATYLTGASGDTAPVAIAADNTGSATIAGYTTAPGYPTLNALVPNIIPNTPGATSGFLTKLTPAADGLTFSTFIPGSGLSSIALDAGTQTLLISGNVDIGKFPIATVQTAIAPIPYQTLLRLPLDGSGVLGSTLLAPGTQSIVTPAPSGAAWMAGDLTLPLLPTTPLSTIGNSYAAHIAAQGSIDQTARFGGLPTAKPAFASVPVSLTALAADAEGNPTFVGSVTPQASVSLVPTETYDLPLCNAPTAALPSTLRDAVPTATSCTLSLCPGSAAYLARLTNSAAPSLALSWDNAPNLTLRNLGSAAASNLSLTGSFTSTTNCPTILPSGAECSITLTTPGPGTFAMQASNTTPQTISIPAFTAQQSAVVVSPKELDFGIQTSTSVAATRTLAVTNLTTQPQTFTSKLDTTSRTLPYTLSEAASDCTVTGPTTRLLSAGATCHVTLLLAASSTASSDTLLNAQWLIGTQDILITGYAQAAALALSASEIDFGTQYTGGLRLPRYLYLSNSSDTAIPHTLIATIAPFTIQDRCPTQLPPHTVCQIQIDYRPTLTPANDSTTLTLDQGLTVLLAGQALPQTGTTGAIVNPNLTVSPATITFPDSVLVTTPSSSTHTVTIGNSGSNPFPLTLALSGDFTDTTNCPATLPGNTTCSVVLTFTPSQPGVRQGLLSVTAGTNSSAFNVSLSGTGIAIMPANNGTLDLGSVPVGQPTVQWLKIAQPFRSFSAATSGDFTAILVEDTGFGHGQPPASAFTSTTSGTCINCWLGLQFTPTATGLRSTTLILTSSSQGNPYTLTLTGTGLALGGVTLTPTTQDFGSVPVGSTSATTLFTVTNLTGSSAPVTLSTPTVTGDFVLSPTASSNPCTTSLNSGASCLLEVAFAPAIIGQRTGILTLTTSAGPVSASLTGYGLPTAALSLSPTALVFRNVPGPTSTTQTITLTNTGTATLQIASPTVTTASFLPATNCNTLAPAAACSITVTFFPGSANVTDALQIPTSAQIAGNTSVTTYSVPLTGTYTAQTSGLQITPAQVNFGPNPVGTLGSTRQFTIANLTAKSLTVTITIPRQFALIGPPCSGLAPNASCTFSVAFVPLTNGDITGSLFAQATPTDGSATLSTIGYVEGYGHGTATLSIGGGLLPGRLLDLGQVASGQTASKTLTLTNTGSSATNLTLRRITTQWPFLSTSTCTQTLAVNQSCTVTITYAPLSQLPSATTSPIPTPDAGVLTLESDATTSPDLIDLTGTVAPVLVSSPSNTAPLLSYTVSQGSLTFPATAIGNISAPQTVTLSNTGTTTLHLLNLTTTSDFQVTNLCGAILPGASCNLIVFFTPQNKNQSGTSGATTRIDALHLFTDSSSSLNFISLIGTSNPPLLTFTPAALDFATVNLGTTSTLPILITNTGTSAATFQGLTATGDYTASAGSCPLPGGTLPPASSCSVQVSFTPVQTGTRSGLLSLATDVSSLSLTANLTGIGAQSRLQIAPATLDFGSISIGSSAVQTLTLTNTGSSPVTGITMANSLVAGLGSGDFALTAPCAVSILVPGAACTASVTFTPTATGTRTGSLIITSSATTSPDRIPLSGSGLGGGSFILTVDGGTTSSATVHTGQPATYTTTLTPVLGFTGTVVLNCTPINPADYTTCSLLPSSITLNGSSQNAQATLQTIGSIKPAATQHARNNTLAATILCALTPTLFFFWRRPETLRAHGKTLWTTAFTAAALATLLTASGCGGGGDPNLRYSTPGNYQYRITANSTTGVQITQSVTLNLTIQSR